MKEHNNDKLDIQFLSSLLNSPSSISTLDKEVALDDFSDPLYYEIYTSIMTFFIDGKTPTISDLRFRYRDDALLLELLDKIDAGEIVDNISLVYGALCECNKKERLKKLGAKLSKQAEAKDISSDSIIEEIESNLLSFNIERGKGLSAVSDFEDDYLKELYARVEKYDRFQNISSVIEMPTGFRKLDEATLGLQRKNIWLIGGSTSDGKALKNDTMIPTPDGWIRIDCLKVGDHVFGSSGEPVKVLGVYPQGIKQLYTVKFNDGTSIDCCGEHLWFTSNRNERKGGSLGSVKNTAEIAKTIYAYKRGGPKENAGRLNHHLSFVSPIQYPKRELPLDPYVLGVLLGDGCITQIVELSTADTFILNEVERRIGITVKKRKHNKYDYLFTTERGKTNPLLEALKKLELRGTNSKTKFIPKQYLMASIEQRLELLQGLCDTDGSVNQTTRIEYSTSSTQLCKDILELIRSLGGRVTYNTRYPKYIYRGKKLIGALSYRLSISFNNGIIPFLLPRKRDNYCPSKSIEYHKKAVISVTTIDKAPCTCILVNSADHLFVAKDYILTHNTQLAIQFSNSILLSGQSVYYFMLEDAKEQLLTRILSLRSGVPISRIRTGNINEYQIKELQQTLNSLKSESRLYIEDDMADINQIVMKVKFAKLKYPELGLVVIDHIGNAFDSTYRGSSREQELTLISKKLLYLIAKRSDVAVLLLQQLNTNPDARKYGMPVTNNDVRDSKSTTFDAAVVTLIHCPDKYDEEANYSKEHTQLIVTKNRYGEANIVIDLTSKAAVGRFIEGIPKGKVKNDTTT